MKLSKKTIVAGVIALVVIVAGVGFFVWYGKYNSSPERLEQKLYELQQQATNLENEIEYQKKLQEIVDNPLPELLPSDQTSATEDQQVPGVEIIINGDKKNVINHLQGYSVEVPSFLIISRSINNSFIEFHNPDTMCLTSSCPPEISILAMENEADQSLDEFIRAESYYDPAGKKVTSIGGQTAYEFLFDVDDLPPKNVYFFSKNKKIYKLNIVTNPKYKIVTDSFKFSN